MQFDESSEKYRCCCQCCHVKTGAAIVGAVELVVSAVILINSLFLIANTTTEYNEAMGVSNSEIFVPFGLALIGLLAGVVSVFLMFAAIVNKAPAMIIPHLLLQVIAILLLAATTVMGLLALATDRTIFYRVLNAIAFRAPPDTNTVSLDGRKTVHVYAVVSLYATFCLLEMFFLYVVWLCYVYLREKRDYMHYCQHYCMPMKNVQARSNAANSDNMGYSSPRYR